MATDARERILEAACDLIASDGIDDVRIARVAMKAGASTALVHHYFSTREELLEQALVHSFETAGSERFGDESADDSSPTRGLARAIAMSLPFPGQQERDWTLWVELWLRAVRDPQLRPLAADLYGRYREWFATFIAAGLESGEFRSERSVAELADLAVGLVDGLGIRALVRDPEMDIDAARRLIGTELAAALGIEPDGLRLRLP
jgi:AcrR family transcriptional regulator